MNSPQASDTKERPILFSSEMVKAILEGRKTMTRRIMKPQLEWRNGLLNWDGTRPKAKKGSGAMASTHDFSDKPYFLSNCPYGKVGERLWVRETFYKNIHEDAAIYIEQMDERFRNFWRKTPSIHMKRKYSRILLEITDVKVERLQDISEEDAISEGISRHGPGFPFTGIKFKNPVSGALNSEATSAFKGLWNCINGDFAWDANPWVWVVSFKVIQPAPSNDLATPLPLTGFCQS